MAEDEAVLADRLKELREHTWPSEALIQNQLGAVFGVSGATISAWESATNPKKPTAKRLEAYARFFATERSLDGEPHLLPDADLTADERSRFEELKDELLGLLNPPSTAPSVVVRGSVAVADTSLLGDVFTFHDGSVTVICPEAPESNAGRWRRRTTPTSPSSSSTVTSMP